MSNTGRENEPPSRMPGQDGETGGRLDTSDLLYEVGRRIQAVALVMRRHRIVQAQQLCECGRVAVRVLQLFGLRCEVACHQWDLAYALILRLLPLWTSQTSDTGTDRRAVGRAAVPSRVPRRRSLRLAAEWCYGRRDHDPGPA